ncbi:unnamed protein product, partial [Notodromas monacha]
STSGLGIGDFVPAATTSIPASSEQRLLLCQASEWGACSHVENAHLEEIIEDGDGVVEVKLPLVFDMIDMAVVMQDMEHLAVRWLSTGARGTTCKLLPTLNAYILTLSDQLIWQGFALPNAVRHQVFPELVEDDSEACCENLASELDEARKSVVKIVRELNRKLLKNIEGVQQRIDTEAAFLKQVGNFKCEERSECGSGDAVQDHSISAVTTKNLRKASGIIVKQMKSICETTELDSGIQTMLSAMIILLDSIKAEIDDRAHLLQEKLGEHPKKRKSDSNEVGYREGSVGFSDANYAALDDSEAGDVSKVDDTRSSIASVDGNSGQFGESCEVTDKENEDSSQFMHLLDEDYEALNKLVDNIRREARISVFNGRLKLIPAEGDSLCLGDRVAINDLLKPLLSGVESPAQIAGALRSLIPSVEMDHGFQPSGNCAKKSDKANMEKLEEFLPEIDSDEADEMDKILFHPRERSFAGGADDDDAMLNTGRFQSTVDELANDSENEDFNVDELDREIASILDEMEAESGEDRVEEMIENSSVLASLSKRAQTIDGDATNLRMNARVDSSGIEMDTFDFNDSVFSSLDVGFEKVVNAFMKNSADIVDIDEDRDAADEVDNCEVLRDKDLNQSCVGKL